MIQYFTTFVLLLNEVGERSFLAWRRFNSVLETVKFFFDFLKGRAYSGTGTGSSKCRIRTELKEATEAGKGEALAYSDKLVRDFIDKIEVCPSMLRVALKAGVSTMVKM